MAIAALALYRPWRRSTPSSAAQSPQVRPKAQQSYKTTTTPQKVKSPPARVAAVEDTATASPWPRPRHGGRPKTSRKKWREKRMDSEFDMVIVPPDGISMSASDSDDSDWSIGWFEPHCQKFSADQEDSFAVLMPCYGSSPPPPPTEAPKAPNLARQFSADHKGRLERWLSIL